MRVAPRATLLVLVLLAAGCAAPAPAQEPTPEPREDAPMRFGPPVVPEDVDASEPYLVIDPEGRLVLSAMPGNTPERPVGMPWVSRLWISEDGGASWRSSVPNAPLLPNGVGFGGGDSAPAVAPDGTLYVSDLWVGSSAVSVSRDHGRTWTTTPLSSTVPYHDRQWMAVDGDGRAYVVSRALFPPVAEWVHRSDDGGQSWQLVGRAWTMDASRGAGWTNGNVAWDAHANALRTVFTCANRSICLATSTDAGVTWTHEVAVTRAVDPGTIFPVLAVDDAGGLHLAWSEETDGAYHVWAASRAGERWGEPRRVSGSEGTHVLPWMVAGAAGRVAIAWYATDAEGDPNDAAAMKGAQWHVHVAHTENGERWVATRATTDSIHEGTVSTRGAGAAASQDAPDWSLGDMLTLALAPDGRVHVAFTLGTEGRSPPRAAVISQVDGPRLR